MRLRNNQFREDGLTSDWVRYVLAILVLLIGGGSPAFGLKYDPTGKLSLDGKPLESPNYLPFTQLTLELSVGMGIGILNGLFVETGM